MSGVKLSLSREALSARPIAVRAGHAVSTYLRKFASAFGAGSVAITSKPFARNSAAQLAPITPVPTIAMRRTGLSKAMSFSPCLRTELPIPRLKARFAPTSTKRRSQLHFLAGLTPDPRALLGCHLFLVPTSTRRRSEPLLFEAVFGGGRIAPNQTPVRCDVLLL